MVAQLLQRRVRACEDLGLHVPNHLRSGPPETLLLRLTGVDRRLSCELDARGGVALPFWKEHPDPFGRTSEDDLPWWEDEEDDDDDVEEQGEPVWAA